jgi:hypothetical protein
MLRIRVETIHNIVNAGGGNALAATYAAPPQVYRIGRQEPITYLPVRPIGPCARADGAVLKCPLSDILA